MRTQRLLLLLRVGLALAGATALARSAAPVLVEGRFGRALYATESYAVISPRPTDAAPPFTVEFWARVGEAGVVSVLVAAEAPDSGSRWEVFTSGRSKVPGRLSASVGTRHSPVTITSVDPITDGRWHYVALTHDGTTLRLYVDAKEVASQRAPRAPAATIAGPLVLGSRFQPESAPGCSGELDEVRLSRGLRPIDRIPEAPFSPDADTLGLWHMDELVGESVLADAANSGRPATIVSRLGRSLNELDRAWFSPGPSPLAGEAVSVALTPGVSPAVSPRWEASLDGGWRLAEGGNEADRLHHTPWADAIPAQVPGSVHGALVAAGRIPDPMFARNDTLARAQSFKTWWLRRDFTCPTDRRDARLSFGGVANRCTVWLNGRLLGSHEGMFGGPSFDVAGLLRDSNSLVVKLEPVTGDPSALKNETWRQTVVVNCVWGWHYASIPSLGLWRSVRLAGRAPVTLAPPFVSTRDIETGEIDLLAELTGEAAGGSGRLTGTIAPENFAGAPQRFELTVPAGPPQRQVLMRLRIPEHRLWWPNGLGEQNLYRLTLAFSPEEGGAADVRTTTFGLRTVTMAPLPGGPRSDRYNWTFVINGRPVFLKGSGWCTLDPLLDFSRERYARFITLAKSQHNQIMRAWGGGLPETDDFYDLCDRAGLLIIQEWPTCWNSHLTQPLAVLEETVRLNMVRLRSHPSLAMWCGGNEIPEPFSPAIDLMGRLAWELDGTRPFHRGEPGGGSEHNYETWWGRQPLDASVGMEATFWGEFGMPSMPVLESVRRYLPEAEQNLWPAPAGGSLAHHTPTFNTGDDLKWLLHYAKDFGSCATLPDFVRASQLAQVVGLRHALERARTRWPDCTGAIYYKLTDVYPAASWATVDWYGAPKLAHWFCQQAFAPLHACVIFDRIELTGGPHPLPVFLLDDADALRGARWEVAVRAYDGALRRLASRTFTGSGSIRAPLRLGELALSAAQAAAAPLFVVVEVRRDGVLADRTFYFANAAAAGDRLHQLPPATVILRAEDGHVTLVNEGPVPAVGVTVLRPGNGDTFFASENALWLEPGESKRLAVSSVDGVRVETWNRRNP